MNYAIERREVKAISALLKKSATQLPRTEQYQYSINLAGGVKLLVKPGAKGIPAVFMRFEGGVPYEALKWEADSYNGKCNFFGSEVMAVRAMLKDMGLSIGV